MESWLDKAITECLTSHLQDIVKHYSGKLEILVSERDTSVIISIFAGKRFNFEMSKLKVRQLNK